MSAVSRVLIPTKPPYASYLRRNINVARTSNLPLPLVKKSRDPGEWMKSLYYKNSPNDFPYLPSAIYGRARDNAGWGDHMFICKYSTGYYRNFEDYFAPNNYWLIRYADVLLMYAECIIETGGSPMEALTYVNKVRRRPSTNLPALENSIYSDALSSGEKFLKRLQMERSLELCFEGWRWADLKRWGLLNSQAGIDELKSRDTVFNNFISGKHHRLPIPQIEVDNVDGKINPT